MNTSKQFKVKDHSVSKEEFMLSFNEEFELYETIPQPSLEVLPSYYESEDYISHTNSKRNLFEKLYHFVRSQMLGLKLKTISNNATNRSELLDIGCGTGDFLLKAQQNGWTVTGIEPNLKARGLAQEKGLAVFDVPELLNLKHHSFDVITLWHVLEHLPKLETHVQIFKNLLKPNGLLVVAVPNYRSYDAKHYKINWAAYDVPRHLWHFSKTSIEKLFSKFGFELFDIKPMWFDAFYISILSEKIKGSKFSFIKGGLLGAFSNFKAIRTKEFSSHIYLLRPKT